MINNKESAIQAEVRDTQQSQQHQNANNILASLQDNFMQPDHPKKKDNLKKLSSALKQNLLRRKNKTQALRGD